MSKIFAQRFLTTGSVDGVVASIAAFQAVDLGSIPGRRIEVCWGLNFMQDDSLTPPIDVIIPRFVAQPLTKKTFLTTRPCLKILSLHLNGKFSRQFMLIFSTFNFSSSGSNYFGFRKTRILYLHLHWSDYWGQEIWVTNCLVISFCHTGAIEAFLCSVKKLFFPQEFASLSKIICYQPAFPIS